MIFNMQNNFFKTIITFCVIVSLVGCSTDYQRTQTGGAVLGALAGATAGAALGVGTGLLIGVLTGDKNQAVNAAVALGTAGAIAGGTLGGMQGYKWGTAVARKKQDYANSEDYLNACIADTQLLRQNAEKANATLKQNIQKLNAETAALLAKGKPTKGQVSSLKKHIASNQAFAEDGIKRIDTEIAIQQNAISSTEGSPAAKVARAKLQVELAALRIQKKQLAIHNDELAQNSGRLGV